MVLKPVPTIPCIAGSACTVATAGQTCQALMQKEAKFVMAQPDAVGCKVGCRNPRSGMWSQSGEDFGFIFVFLEVQDA